MNGECVERLAAISPVQLRRFPRKRGVLAAGRAGRRAPPARAVCRIHSFVHWTLLRLSCQGRVYIGCETRLRKLAQDCQKKASLVPKSTSTQEETNISKNVWATGKKKAHAACPHQLQIIFATGVTPNLPAPDLGACTLNLHPSLLEEVLFPRLFQYLCSTPLFLQN